MKKLMITAAVLAILTGAEIYRSNCFIQTERITVIIGKLPRSFDGFKIAHVSDLHAYQHGENNIELCELIRKENVDIIVITGDIVSVRSDVAMVYETAKNLADIAPVYFVYGNHEYGIGGGWRDVESELERAGVTVLRDRAVELWRGDEGITLLGIDDPNGRGTLNSADVVQLAKRREPDMLIALYHRYDDAEQVAAAGADIMLSGHAHGGLIRLPFTDGIIGPGHVVLPKHTSGLYDVNGMSLVTSRGLGNVSISFRMLGRLHLPIVTLRCD